MTTTTNDEKQVHHALSALSNLRRALCTHKDARSSQGWSGSSAERKKLARAASRFQQAACAEAWHNLGPSIDQSVGHLWGHLDVYADVDYKFVSDSADVTLSKMEDVEQALRSRLDGSLLTFPITASDLTRLAGLKNVPSVTGQIDRAINKHRKRRDKAQLAKRTRGKVAKYSESDLRQAYPNLRKSQLKEFFASALEIK